jgi:protein TonB
MKRPLLCVAACLTLVASLSRAETPGTQVAVAAPQLPAPVAAFSPAKTLDAYKAEVARHIYGAGGAKDIFEEPARPLLKAVIVMSITIAADGTTRASIVRSNGIPELETLALQSVKRASPVPRWHGAAEGEEIAYMETWLFRHDDRFQIRSIAPLQLTE